MNDTLLWILSFLSIFVIYWIFVGQAKHKQMMQSEEMARMAEQQAMGGGAGQAESGADKTETSVSPSQKAPPSQ